jgi:hypothetical protein
VEGDSCLLLSALGLPFGVTLVNALCSFFALRK